MTLNDLESNSNTFHAATHRSQDGGGSTPGSVHEVGDIPPLRTTKLRHSAATESESECRDSGFNEGPPYPDTGDSHVYADYDGQSYRSRHYSEDSRLSYAPEDYPHGHKYYISEERMFNYATTFMPNYEQRRLRRNRYNYLDDYDNYQDFQESDKYYDTSSLSREHSDSFIYVSYPPDVKKRFNENRWWKNRIFYVFLYLKWRFFTKEMPKGTWIWSHVREVLWTTFIYVETIIFWASEVLEAIEESYSNIKNMFPGILREVFWNYAETYIHEPFKQVIILHSLYNYLCAMCELIKSYIYSNYTSVISIISNGI